MSSADVKERLDEITKPDQDERLYRHLLLRNELSVLLISDGNADKAAAAMDVAVGHASDPPELPGLAHFLEHMLFLGTEKYPDEGSYQQFLQEHGGSSNAFTAFEDTNFYFDVQHPHLQAALDRFAQFFLCPSFTESAAGRELKAVHSENEKNLQSDGWRLNQLYKSMASEAHPYHKFGTGNLHTLRDRPEGRAAVDVALDDSGEVGVHFGITCDGSGVSPIVGRRYKMIGEDYDLCEAVYKQLSADDAAKFELVPPPRADDPAAERARAAAGGVHHGITCDGSGVCPIVGRRFKMVGHDFDLCEEQFAQLDDDDRVKFELVAPPPPPPRVKVCIKPDARPAVNVREALFAFHKQHYSANAMRLVVVGREDLDTLEAWVAPLFAQVANINRPKPVWSAAAYPDDAPRRSLAVVPVRDLRSLSVVWSMPSVQPLHRTKPHRYLSHLLGHESEGSLLSLLKSRNWVDSLVAGETHVASDFSLFEVKMDLSEEGDAAVSEIVPYIFQYISMLGQSGPAEWVYAECRDIGAMSFRFKEPEEPIDAACGLASSLQLYPPAEVLCAPYLFRAFDAPAISRLLALLTPERASVVHVSERHTAKADCREEWYGTAFACEPPSAEELAAWRGAAAEIDAALALPQPNPFIPTEFGLACDAASAAADNAAADNAPPPPSPPVFPRLLRDDEWLRLWHKTDATFRRPKANVYIDLLAPAAYHSPPAAVLTRIFSKQLADELTEFSYHAECAGLHYSVYNCSTGLRLILSGYNHKLPVLLSKVLAKLAHADLTAERFVVQKDIVAREYANFWKEQPYQHAMYAASHLLELSRWYIGDYLEYTQSAALTHEAYVSFVRTQLLEMVHLQALCHGNVGAADARTWFADALAALPAAARPLRPSQRPAHRALELPEGSEVVLRSHPSTAPPLQKQHSNADESNSAVEVYLQVGIDERPRTMVLELVAQALTKPAYHQLRTVEQLGYIVFSGVRHDLGVVGFRVLVQSSEKDAAELDARIECFLGTVGALLDAMGDDEFGNHKKALIDLKLEKDKKLRQESGRYWSEIPLGTYDFERSELDAEALKAITKADVRAFWDEHLAPGAPRRRRLSSQVFASRHALPPPPAGARCLETPAAVVAYKRTRPAYPAPGAVEPPEPPSEYDE